MLAHFQEVPDRLEPLRDERLVSIAGRLVVPDSDEVVGQVLLRCDVVGRVVRVDVPLPVAQARRARVVRVAQVGGDGTALARAQIRQGAVDPRVRGVRLRRRGDRDDGLGQEIRASGMPTMATACAALTQVVRTSGAAMPTSSEAAIMTRRAMKRGSSPASIIRAR